MGGYIDVAIFFHVVTYVTKIFDRIIMSKKYKARRQNVSGLFLCLEVRRWNCMDANRYFVMKK